MIPEPDEYAFEGQPWTVGKLREALQGLPDDLPLTALAEFEAGEVDDYVIVHAGLLSEMVVEPLEPELDEYVLLCALRLEDDEEEDDDGDDDDDEIEVIDAEE
jgi:hypothetical protein